MLFHNEGGLDEEVIKKYRSLTNNVLIIKSKS